MPAPKGNKYAEGNPGGGRPTDYKPEYCKVAYKVALLGATDVELASVFDVTEQTIINWKKEHKDFFLALKKGKVIADAEIGKSLYKRAKGFKKRQVKIFQNNGTSFEHEYDEYYPPDPTSMIYWLKNRRGRVNEAEGAQKWADKHEHVHDGSIPVRLVFEDDPKNKPLHDTGGDSKS